MELMWLQSDGQGPIKTLSGKDVCHESKHRWQYHKPSKYPSPYSPAKAGSPHSAHAFAPPSFNATCLRCSIASSSSSPGHSDIRRAKLDEQASESISLSPSSSEYKGSSQSSCKGGRLRPNPCRLACAADVKAGHRQPSLSICCHALSTAAPKTAAWSP